MRNKPTDYVLGLDIGIASVGAALLAEDHIINLFVRTFKKAETDKEGESLNKIRRESRLLRRRLRRRVYRLKKMRRLFKKAGLLQHPNEFFEQKIYVSPWQLRAEGLDRKLTPLEWANVLYHLVKHRGFQSNRKSELNSDDKETGKMLGSIIENQALLEQKQYRTVGEMAWIDEKFALQKRNKGGQYHHTFARTDLAAELVELFKKQRSFGNSATSFEFEQNVMTLLMERKPMQNILHLIGKCTFEPKELRAPKASYFAERFVWLTKLNNLRIMDMGATRALTAEERQQLLDIPFKKAKLSYKQLRKKLGLTDTEKFIGLAYKDDKDPESSVLYEAKAFHKLRLSYEQAGLIEQWKKDSCSPVRLNELAYALTVYKEDAEISEHLKGCGFEDEIIEAVLKVSFTEFIRLSLKALEKIIPFMETGHRYDEAVIMAGYTHHSQTQKTDRINKIPPIDGDDITNPVVRRSLNQARKLVNAIVDKYGPPYAVNIELARDLNKSLDERNKIKREQDKFQTEKKDASKHFVETFGQEPKKDDLLKFRLYREQNAQCAYTQKPLDVERIFNEPGYAEIDHALPYSRSFDNSLNNKVLVLGKENRDKGNKTPYEYLDGSTNSEKWQRFAAWVSSNKNYRMAKKQRLLRKDFGSKEAEEFRERNLNDTRYICKKFKELVETHLQLSDDSKNRRCRVVTGQMTAYLRHRWGLNKNRAESDLHHALDAAVVAGCTHTMIKRLADFSRKKELSMIHGDFVDPETGEILDAAGLVRAEKYFPQPFPDFRKELEARLSPNPVAKMPSLMDVAPIRVSRAVSRRGTGEAHKDTIRSIKFMEQGQSALKTPLEKLKLKDLPNIVGYGDPRNKALMELIKLRLEQHKDEGKKAFTEPLYKPANNGKQGPLVKKVNVLTTQKSGLFVRNGIADNGDMLRVDIFTKGGKFYAIPLYVSDTVKTELPNRAVVAYKPESEWTVIDDSFSFMFSLHHDDWVKVTFKNKTVKEGYFAGLDRATGAVSIRVHDRNKAVGKDGLMRGIGIKTVWLLEKFHVDMLGGLHRVHSEQRKPLRRR